MRWTNRGRFTFLTTLLVRCCRRSNVWQSDLCSVVRAEDVDIYHRLESVRRQWRDWSEEIASSTGYRKVDAPELFYALFHRRLKACHVSDINGPNTEHHGSVSRAGDVLGYTFCLFDIPSYNASICAKVDKCPDLSAADATGAASAEYYLVI